MKLSELMEGLGVSGTYNFADRDVTGVCIDSRKIRKGEIFIAVRGHKVDGHDFIGQAEEAGASALVVERKVDSGIPVVVVPDSAAAEAHIARIFHGDPGSKLRLAGITGTNGKTSTACMLKSIFEAAGETTGLIGTIGYGTARDLKASDQTTPSSSMIYSILADFVAKGCGSAVMEVSSHAAAQGRTRELEFDAGIFTNITRDHLDYHGTFEKYVSAKEIFADSLLDEKRRKGPGMLVYNIDDPHVRKIGEKFDGPKVSYGTYSGSAVALESLRADMKGTGFTIRTPEFKLGVEMRLLGRFSAYNAIAAAAAAWSFGIASDHIKAGLENLDQIPGRFQVLTGRSGPAVVIDYAHTPDALENLLRFCRDLGPDRLVAVFGCGGDRDRGKRPMMGRIASELSDLVYVTSDNPRTEDPDAIIGEILGGIGLGGAEIRVVRDRSGAIADAVSRSAFGDLVVIAGKGHEDYQIIGTRKVHFSDTEEALKALDKLEVGHQDRT